MFSKYYFVFFLLLFICFSCNNKTDENLSNGKKTLTVKGLDIDDSSNIKPNKNVDLSKYLVIKDDYWRTDENRVLGKLDISIKNDSDMNLKDVVLLIKYYAESGTFLIKQNKTIYKIFPKGQTVVLKDINTGIVDEDAYFGVVSIVSAIQDN